MIPDQHQRASVPGAGRGRRPPWLAPGASALPAVRSLDDRGATGALLAACDDVAALLGSGRASTGQRREWTGERGGFRPGGPGRHRASACGCGRGVAPAHAGRGRLVYRVPDPVGPAGAVSVRDGQVGDGRSRGVRRSASLINPAPCGGMGAAERIAVIDVGSPAVRVTSPVPPGDGVDVPRGEWGRLPFCSARGASAPTGRGAP